ncbi:MAG: hypothetical protein U9N14_04880 [Pseudomonadota bacterium]|nr:hypothetical protein [Pseudomonadota bacterium]
MGYIEDVAAAVSDVWVEAGDRITILLGTSDVPSPAALAKLRGYEDDAFKVTGVQVNDRRLFPEGETEGHGIDLESLENVEIQIAGIPKISGAAAGTILSYLKTFAVMGVAWVVNGITTTTKEVVMDPENKGLLSRISFNLFFPFIAILVLLYILTRK